MIFPNYDCQDNTTYKSYDDTSADTSDVTLNKPINYSGATAMPCDRHDAYRYEYVTITYSTDRWDFQDIDRLIQIQENLRKSREQIQYLMFQKYKPGYNPLVRKPTIFRKMIFCKSGHLPARIRQKYNL